MQAETELAPDVARVALVRRWARERLTDAGLDEPTLDVLVLLVSESVTNAVVHARPPLVLCLDVDAERTRVEVRDGTSAEPVLRQSVPTQQGGRGMMFIDHLSSRWGTVAHEAEVGKPAGPTLGAWRSSSTCIPMTRSHGRSRRSSPCCATTR
jgi:anti-sigma regulatory factor (Ser/Thr protein kinase)